MKILKTDCLVIGSGAAGSIYALEAADRGLDCIVLSASTAFDSNSFLAQGGIISPQENDEINLFNDIMAASAGTANPAAVKDLIVEGRKILKSYILPTVNFDRKEDGSFDLTREAAHSQARIVHAKDKTGETLTKSLLEQLKKKATLLEKHVAIDLLTLSHSSLNITDKYQPLTCIGAYILDEASGEVSAIQAQRTVLATGGLGQIFANTTNAQDAYGHGVVMAYRIGARVMDMEYVQFHPTALKVPSGGREFLISEALRGEGAFFINRNGDEFMNKVHPAGSLAPRDVISRSIFFELMRSGADSVFLDTSRLSSDLLQSRFPGIYKRCLESGIDITKEAIPVSPAAHYSCGGVFADMRGNTNIKGLKAIGESACTGLHGANRLASTSLLECIVMGVLAAGDDAKSLRKDRLSFPDIHPWRQAETIPDMDLINQDLKSIKSTMWNYVGLVRTEKRLLRAQRILKELKAEIDRFYSDCRLNRPLLNLRSAVQSSRLVTYGALQNPRSLGCHYRDDQLEQAIAGASYN